MSDYELVIVGAGPGGISMAVEAIQAGISHERIVILEKQHEHSWAIRKFYPEQKLVAANYKGKEASCLGKMCLIDSTKSETLSYLDQIIEEHKLNVRYKEDVSKIDKTDAGFSIITSSGIYKTKICVIAIGMMGKPNRPDWKIRPEVRSNVHFDITSEKIINSKVLVVGGGDSAAEYAQYLIQDGNNVMLSYRKESFSRMNEMNLNILKSLEEKDKVKIVLSSSVVDVILKDEKIEVVYENEENCPFDKVILALGGTTPKNFLSLLGIDFNGIEPELTAGYETSVPGLFLVGDLSAGRKGGSIISAFNSSHIAMKDICKNHLECKL